MEDVAVGYAPGEPVLSRLNLRIDDDDRIGLIGANGNGKSTLAKLVAGRLEPQDGRLRRLHRLEVAYFAQHQLDELNPAWSPYDHVRDLMPDATEAQVRARTGALGFVRTKMDTKAADLSGGEKARLLLGLATFGGANLMILDEPTNHLDIDSREALVQALADYPGAVILISHDRHLIEASVDRLWLVADGTVAPYDGDLDDYRRDVLERRAGGAGTTVDASRKPASTTAQDRRREAAERRQQTAPLRKKIKDAEALVESLQKEIWKLDARLGDSGLYERGPGEAAALAKARAEAVRSLAQAEETWLHATAELEAAMVAAD